MYLAGNPTARRTGAKDGRIDVEEWRRFKRALSVSFVRAEAPPPEPPKRGRPAKESTSTPGGFEERFLRETGSLK